MKENMTLTLSDPDARRIFEQHLISEFAVENIRAWEEITLWKQQYPKLPMKSRIASARHIYLVFIPSSAYLCVNVEAATRHELIDLFDLTDEELAAKISPDSFERVLKDVHGMMLGSFQRFQASMQFKQQQHVSTMISPARTHSNLT